MLLPLMMRTVQIKKVNEGSADEDYFLLTPDNSGLLTVKANDNATSREKDSDTSGTLFGTMGTGPMGEMRRAGQIATDSNSGPGNHFQFTVPVEGGNDYLVKVTGTDGVYKLEFAFVQVAHTSDDGPTVTSGPTFTPGGTIVTPADLAGRWKTSLPAQRSGIWGSVSAYDRKDKCRWDSLWAGWQGDCDGL